MGSRTWVFLAVTVTIVMAVAGCGRSNSSSTATKSSVAARQTAPVAPAVSADLKSRLLRNGEFPGFTSGSRPVIALTPQMWLADNQTPVTQIASEAAILERRGFVAGELKVMIGGYGQMLAISVVEQFRDPAGARSELTTQLAATKQNVGPTDQYLTFAAPGIPAAKGFGESSVASGRINVAFTDGDYYYLVAEAGAHSTALKPPALVAAARHLYHRVNAYARGATRIAPE